MIASGKTCIDNAGCIRCVAWPAAHPANRFPRFW